MYPSDSSFRKHKAYADIRWGSPVGLSTTAIFGD